MAEFSGETTSKPVNPETSFSSGIGISANGTQLISIAYLDSYERTYGLLRENPSGFQSIRQQILEDNMQGAADSLKDESVFPKPAGEHASKLKSELIQTIAGGPSRNISSKEALIELELEHDPSLHAFVGSLPSKPLDLAQIKKHERVILPQVEATAEIDPETNELRLTPLGKSILSATIPADKQRPLCIKVNEVFGERSNTTVLNQLELFEELAKNNLRIFTHASNTTLLPTILESGHLGEGTGPHPEEGFWFEEMTFKHLPEIKKTIVRIKSGKKFSIPSEILESFRSKYGNRDGAYYYPFHELQYVAPGATIPVFIFSEKLKQKRTSEGGSRENIDIKDDCLIGIIVSPAYKHHLLHWISTWDEEKRQKIFGDRKPESIFLSSAKDLHTTGQT
jgi:hypothetical protein